MEKEQLSSEKPKDDIIGERLQYEKLLCCVTREALKRQSLTSLMSAVVQRMGEVLDVSRVYMFEYDRVNDVVYNRFEWVDEGVKSFWEEEQAMPAGNFPWWREQMLAGKHVQIDDYRNAPDDSIREMMRRQDTKSILSLPIFAFDMPYGFLGLDECRFNRTWKDEDVELLRSVCVVIAQAIEKERWMEEVVNSERMAAMGRLAGAIAHEINNPLQGMMLHLDLVKSHVEDNKSAKKNLGRIEQGIHRISEITMRIISLNRANAQPEDVDINDTVQGALFLLTRPLERSNCSLESSFDENLVNVSGDKQLLHQAFLNVLLNAMESMGRGGILKVLSRQMNGDVVVEIEDNGVGIEQCDLKSIFEPFFSTKGGARPGLGLFIAREIINNHGGSIEAESIAGKGTKVTIKFPRSTTKS